MDIKKKLLLARVIAKAHRKISDVHDDLMLVNEMAADDRWLKDAEKKLHEAHCSLTAVYDKYVH